MDVKNIKSIPDFKLNLRTIADKFNNADHALRMKCLTQAEEETKNDSAVDTVIAFQEKYDKEFKAFVCNDLMFAGTAGYFYPSVQSAKLTSDIGHYCANYKNLIDSGVNGVLEKIENASPCDELGEKNKFAFKKAWNLFISYMEKHATEAENQLTNATEEQKENLRRMVSDINYICKNKPATFIQALQLIWFAHCYLHLKPYTDTLTLGNLDTALIDLYNEDIIAGRITKKEAENIICYFYLSFETMGRDTQNIVLGGSDKEGNNTENELTELFLNAQAVVHTEQPSVSLKIRNDTSKNVWDSAINLLSKGGGMPSFLNDSHFIKSLKLSGFSEEESNTFCNVGCYEATPYGNTFGGTVTGYMVTPQEFNAFFLIDKTYSSFEDFLKAWREYFKKIYLEKYLTSFKNMRNDIEIRSASPFCGCIMDGCIENLRLPEQYGAKNNIYSVLFSGFATVVDSLLCIKHFVYDTNKYTLSHIREQIAKNYTDENLLRDLRNFPNRFGSCESFSNDLAKEEALFIADLVKTNPFNEQVTMLPALFLFTRDIYAEHIPATPDGRKFGERYSYGVSASELLPHRDITKVLLSSAQLPLFLFPVGTPQTVNLMPNLLQSDKGREVIKNMVQTYFNEGGAHIQINIANPDILRDAQQNPEKYTDLLIRISGHTEPFTRLDKQLQDALIERSQMGC